MPVLLHHLCVAACAWRRPRNIAEASNCPMHLLPTMMQAAPAVHVGQVTCCPRSQLVGIQSGCGPGRRRVAALTSRRRRHLRRLMLLLRPLIWVLACALWQQLGQIPFAPMLVVRHVLWRLMGMGPLPPGLRPTCCRGCPRIRRNGANARHGILPTLNRLPMLRQGPLLHPLRLMDVPRKLPLAPREANYVRRHRALAAPRGCGGGGLSLLLLSLQSELGVRTQGGFMQWRRRRLVMAGALRPQWPLRNRLGLRQTRRRRDLRRLRPEFAQELLLVPPLLQRLLLSLHHQLPVALARPPLPPRLEGVLYHRGRAGHL
mmetsp:Transcript_88857/g.256248  ORF Transcript_88857/g.256248 Transcript_88857/m.256248 type:complete len:317 (+) Transcript_88857:611-1561(+)